MKLALQCPQPQCRGHLAPVEAGSSAIEVADRTCRRCGAKWRLVVRPQGVIANGRAHAHRVDWTCTADATRRRCGECDACQEWILDKRSAPACARMVPTQKKKDTIDEC
jgi:hypothetical protein